MDDGYQTYDDRVTCDNHPWECDVLGILTILLMVKVLGPVTVLEMMSVIGMETLLLCIATFELV